MARAEYPWMDAAILICETENGDRRIAGQGALFAMVHRLMIVKEASRFRYTISLPSRASTPLSLSPSDFGDLIAEHGRVRI